MRIFKWFFIICQLVLLASCQTTGTVRLKPFTTDGCSEFPDGTPAHRDLWHRCCVEHDLKYWAGGTFDERLQADIELRSCVTAVGEPAIAEMMLGGVRVGGSPWWPTSFRWGYGWPYTNGYRALTPLQQEQVRQQKEKQGLQ
jgi:hypothetical protein